MADPHNDVRIAGVERGFEFGPREALRVDLIERLGLAERWECWDVVQGRWRRYWRRHGSLPHWAAS